MNAKGTSRRVPATLLALALAWAAVFTAPSAAADTLILQDGRKLRGPVVKRGATYEITVNGERKVYLARQVTEWIRDGAGDSAAPAPAPGPAPAAPASAVPAPAAPAAPSPAPSTPATRPASRPARAPLDKAQLEKIAAEVIAQGRDALAAGDFVQARARFMDLLDADPNHVEALHGVALGHMALGDRAKALAAINKAFATVERSGRDPSRPLLLNFAMVEISQNRGMRAAKYLVEYLKANPEPLDEPVVNSLGAALWSAPATARTGLLWKPALATYEDFNAKLEARRPGQKRWGVRWVPALEFNKLKKEWDAVEAARQASMAAWQDVVAARKHRSWISTRRLSGAATIADVNAADQRLATAKAAFERAWKAYKDKRAATEPPDFPEALVAVPMDATRPPQGQAVIAAVLATSAQQESAVRTMRVTGREKAAPVDEARPAVRPQVKPADDEPDDDAPPPPPSVVVKRQPGKRTVTRLAAAFPVAPDLLVTSADAVGNARSIQLQDLQGDTYVAVLVRSDPKTGLALVRASGSNLPHVRLADGFAGGAIKCVSLAPASIFDMKADLIAGNLRAGPQPVLSLAKEPKRPGLPLVVGEQVVGVALADRGSNPADLPCATLDQLRAFCGNDLPRGGLTFGSPAEVLCELRAEVEVE